MILGLLFRLRNFNIVWWYITYTYIATCFGRTTIINNNKPNIIRYHTRNRMQTPQIKFIHIKLFISSFNSDIIRTQNTHKHLCLNGIQTHDPSVGAGEDSSWPRDHCDRRMTLFANSGLGMPSVGRAVNYVNQISLVPGLCRTFVHSCDVTNGGTFLERTAEWGVWYFVRYIRHYEGYRVKKMRWFGRAACSENFSRRPHGMPWGGVGKQIT
jgi:hypothetical protein